MWLTNTIRNLWRKQRADAELDEEVRGYVELLAEEKIRSGMAAAQARREAKMELGGVEQVKEQTREIRAGHFLETLWQDVRCGLRMMRKAPGFTAVAILTLALGIGANTAIFSVVNSVVLQPLPFAHPELLAVIGQTTANTPAKAVLQGQESYLNVLDWERETKSFSAMGAYQSSGMTLTGHGAPSVVQGAIVSPGFFAALQVAPLLGRTLEPQDDVKGAGHVVVIGESLWRSELGADPGIIGKTLQLNRDGFTVVGVMPASFRFPDQTPPCEYWIPIRQSTDYAAVLDLRSSGFLKVIARLKPGVSMSQAQSELTIITKQLNKQYNIGPNAVAYVIALKRLVVGDSQTVLLILLGAVALVVLIACANTANLLLAQASGRAKEIAVRVALGAGRARIFRQLLTESVLLGICAGAVGLLLAYGGVAAIKAFASDQLPHLRSISVDGWVLLFTFGLSVFAGILFGLAPAWQSSEIDLNEVLRESGRGAIGGARRRWTRNVLVVGEVAMAVVLLTGSGLLLRSFYLLTHASTGFDPQQILTADVSLPQSQYVKPEQWKAFYRQAVERLKSLPGVEDAAAALPLPFTGSNLGYGVTVEGRPVQANQTDSVLAHSITPDYFRVMRIPLLRGREFNESDTAPNAPRVVIISETLARYEFAHQDPLAQSLKIYGVAPPYVSRIVGVVGDVKDKTLADASSPMIYLPYTQESWWTMSFVVRTKVNPSSVATALQTQIHELDSALPVQDVRPLTSLISDSEGDARFRSILLGLFGVLALVLASVGIYSVLACIVAQRTNEIGIRMALGAQRRDVLRLVVGQGMRTVLAGVAIGVGAALGLSRVLGGFLYGVSAKDPATFAGVATLLTLVALLACYIPARRAMRVDPMTALRYE